MASDPRRTDSGIEVKPVYGPDDRIAWDPDLALGVAGRPPFTRGIYPTMYRGRPWTIRQYSGFGNAEATNERWRALLAGGGTGLSCAFDLPTQMGYDSDHPRAEGEVGKVGVAIDSIDDMRILLDGLPLADVTTSMTINATAAVLLLLYQLVAEERGIPAAELGGTVQNDILKEYIARGTYIYPPRPSMRIVTDIFAYCHEHLPSWNTISISGYHIREAGSTAVQELAFTLADGIAYVQAAIDAGLDVDEFAPRLSFFWNAHNNLFEEVAKFRASRRMWARIMTDRFGARSDKSKLLRFHTQTGGSTLTAQQPENNIARVTLQSLAAVLGGTQSLHANGFDEALGLPTSRAARIAVRTQQIIAAESGVSDTVDPLGGSYFVEALTDAVEADAWDYLDKIDAMGGAVAAIEVGYQTDEIERAAYEHATAVDRGDKVIVGVNRFVDDTAEAPDVFPIDPALQVRQIERVRRTRTERDAGAVAATLARLGNVAHSSDNLLPPMKEALRLRATLGEVSDVLRNEFGAYQPRADGPIRLVIIGGGPGGNSAATTAARLGANVTLIEKDILGGAAHLWDCIPSKTMIATGGAMSFAQRLGGMGLSHLDAHLDVDAQRQRIGAIETHLNTSVHTLLESQGVRLIKGCGRVKGPHEVVAETDDGIEELEADAIVVSTGTRPRIPEWCAPDGDRILTTRQAYPPRVMPDHLVVIGSGVTGVEFVHMFTSFGAAVTLIVSRQQVLPNKDPEVAAALENELLRRGVRLLKGARAEMIERTESGGVAVACDDGRVANGSHALFAIGSIPNSDGLGLESAGVELDEGGYVRINHHCQSNVGHIYAAGDVSGKLPLSSVAAMQGRKVAEHVMGLSSREHRHIDYEKAASAIFTEPEIADVGLAEAEAFATGRKIRVTKVPYASTAKALINDDPGGFVKILSDPATGVVLGGSIVGRHAAELISVIALAVTANLKVSDIVESCLVHPTLSEALADAAD